MSTGNSDCLDHFGYPDFKPLDVDPAVLRPPVCPVKDCSTKLLWISFGKREKPYCPTHGLRLHSKTFVYWNGEARKDDARLRNFRISQKLARMLALNSPGKAETHRLGYEMSEDALTWNVFAGLAQARKLSKAVRVLTGRQIDVEPTLYLWGKPIDINNPDPDAEVFAPLCKVRNLLEENIGTFKTEPDAMLVVPDSLVVCIEAKFGSGNTLAHDGDAKVKVGDKPVDRDGLLDRYLDSNKTPVETKRVIDRNQIATAPRFHSQLFRNIVFASAMAEGREWHVVNLVSKTQHEQPTRKEPRNCSFDNPEDAVRAYLHEDSRKRFTYRTWEGLYKELIKDDESLGELSHYLHTKSAHYHRAFNLE